MTTIYRLLAGLCIFVGFLPIVLAILGSTVTPAAPQSAHPNTAGETLFNTTLFLFCTGWLTGYLLVGAFFHVAANVVDHTNRAKRASGRRGGARIAEA